MIGTENVATGRSRLIPRMQKGIPNLEDNPNLPVKFGEYPMSDMQGCSSYGEPGDLGNFENSCNVAKVAYTPSGVLKSRLA